MEKCKACGRDFASTNPNTEICYPCNNALKRLNGYAVPVVRCKDCKHPKPPAVLTQKYGEPGTLTCHNWHSPCNKRNVKQDDFCSYGERKDND